MKKMLTALLALMMALSLCTAALSEEDENTVQLDKNTTTGETEVSLTVSIVDDYTVVIPASVTIDPETQEGQGTITLKAGYVLGGEAQILKVMLTEAKNGILSKYLCLANNASATEKSNALAEAAVLQNFCLLDENGTPCSYSVKASNSNTAFSAYQKPAGASESTYYCTNYNTFALISAESTEDNTADKTCTLTYYVETLPKTGIYTDTLTFSIFTY